MKQTKKVKIKVEEEEYKILPLTFEGRGTQKDYVFTQLKREGDLAIYEKHDAEIGKSYFETIVIKRHKGIQIQQNWLEATEVYPSDNQFGVKGWCCLTLEIAEQRYQELKTQKHIK